MLFYVGRLSGENAARRKEYIGSSGNMLRYKHGERKQKQADDRCCNQCHDAELLGSAVNVAFK